jgi:hypothetical protein
VPGAGLPPDVAGPPAPAMIVPLRRRQPSAPALRRDSRGHADGPFAALAAFRP